MHCPPPLVTSPDSEPYPNLGVRESDDPSGAEIIYERRRWRFQSSGLPCEEHPPGYFRCGGSSVIDAEVLRNARAERSARDRNRSKIYSRADVKLLRVRPH
jgi:hypothetical protein